MTRVLRLNVNDRYFIEHSFDSQLTHLNLGNATVLSFTVTFMYFLFD